MVLPKLFQKVFLEEFWKTQNECKFDQFTKKKKSVCERTFPLIFLGTREWKAFQLRHSKKTFVVLRVQYSWALDVKKCFLFVRYEVFQFIIHFPCFFLPFMFDDCRNCVCTFILILQHEALHLINNYTCWCRNKEIKKKKLLLKRLNFKQAKKNYRTRDSPSRKCTFISRISWLSWDSGFRGQTL